MKQFAAVYIFIGLLLSPFIHSNNAWGHRNVSNNQGWVNSVMLSALYWPSYVFFPEPEVNNETLEIFKESLAEIVNYRNDRLFTGKRTSEHGRMMLRTITNCIQLKVLNNDLKTSVNFDDSSLYPKFFDGSFKEEYLNILFTQFRDDVDGYDFADFVEKGDECKKELLVKIDVNKDNLIEQIDSTKKTKNITLQNSDNSDRRKLIVSDSIDNYIKNVADREEGAEYKEQRQVFKSDMTGDNKDNIIVKYIIEGAGGSNSSYASLAIFNYQDDKYILLADKAIRTGEVVDISSKSIRVKTLEYSPDDARCCPSLEGEFSYSLQVNNIFEKRTKEATKVLE